MTLLRHIYRVVRSLLLTAILMVAGLYTLVYVLVAIPAVQDKLRAIACRELSPLLGGDLEVGKLTINPFSEISLRDVTLTGPGETSPCISVALVDATIDMWALLSERQIEIPYAEISGLRADITQKEKEGPLNIDFLIQALKSKDKNKPPTEFSLLIRKAVIRGSSASFSRLWAPRRDGVIDFNHLKLTRLNADLDMPVLSNDTYSLHLHRLGFQLDPGFTVENLSLEGEFSPRQLSLRDFRLHTRNSLIILDPIELQYPAPSDIPSLLAEKAHRIGLTAPQLTPSDFAVFLPSLARLDTSWTLRLAAAGTTGSVCLDTLNMRHKSSSSSLLLTEVKIDSLRNPGSLTIAADGIDLHIAPALTSDLLALLPGATSKKSAPFLAHTGDVRLRAKGSADLRLKKYMAEGDLTTGAGSLDFDLIMEEKRIAGHIDSEGIAAGRLLGHDDLGKISLTADADITLPESKVKNGWPVGRLDAEIGEAILRGHRLEGISVTLDMTQQTITADVTSADPLADLDAEAILRREYLRGGPPHYTADVWMEVKNLVPSAFMLLPKYPGYSLATTFRAHAEGSEPSSAVGVAMLRNSRFHNAKGKGPALASLLVSTDIPEPGRRRMKLESDWADAAVHITGEAGDTHMDFRHLGESFLNTLAQTLPGLLPTATEARARKAAAAEGNAIAADFNLRLKAAPEIYTFFALPAFPLGEGTVEGFYDAAAGTSEISLDFPYIQQGRNKLIEGTSLSAILNRSAATCGLQAKTHYPAKKGDLDIDLKIMARKGQMFADVGFNRGQNALLSGGIALNAALSRNPFTRALQAKVEFVPSVVSFHDSPWNIENGRISWDGSAATVENLRIHRGRQFVGISGKASKSPADSLSVSLAGIDLDYVFSALNIDYVKFGGLATGEVNGSALLSGEPRLATRRFNVKNFSYNDALLGDAVIRSRFDVPRKMVAIDAEISEERRPRAEVSGGIWIGRDSLSFDIDAHSANVAFMNQFVQAFATDVSGAASGKVKLFGTFSDIDLTGQVKADSLSLRLLSTNVVYHGADSVYMTRGRITIPGFTIYDRNGNSALLSGELTHRYFHDPVFDFRLTNARELLCYDTTPLMNPVWWGTIYGSGTGHLEGRPGMVGVDVDMTTTKGSDFTFVLTDRESAADYNFLTFTDKRKEAVRAAEPDSEPEFLKKFRRRAETPETGETTVMLDFRATVTPEAKLTLVMDPEGGDKITCHGGGPIQMLYDSATEELKMYGRYVLDEGDYNFTLQDIILKEFHIKPGSSIAFNGDPLKAILDIGATYRVNTSLTDLDQSFANDRELNRTNVPVDAVLNVHGDLTSPDINFDLELPTLSSDVERKVKSLISTDDLMSRQIIYLLALNRFYTPEYAAGNTTSGAELSSVASSTLSSQLSNILSSMTDRLSLAPSFRSDKGDFSDMEVDLALSSRLLDNRLLINGNFGYRDRGASTQSTQFIGDFDIEYLLNKSGNLRLKAYNRFNDQSYYLRQALTTQGVGLVVRRDFDNIFSFLRPLKKKKKEPEETMVRTEEKIEKGDGEEGKDKTENDTKTE